MAPFPEAELIKRLTAHERQAWDTFVDRYAGLVYSRIARAAEELRVQIDASEHDDLCAEVFASLLANDCRSLKSFEGRCRLSTWLATVTRRICLRKLQNRRALVSVQAHDSSERAIEPATSGSSEALAQLIRREEQSGVRTAMQRLKATDREILTLFYVQGLKYSEIGKQMNISPNTVGPKLQRAQRRLRRILEAPTEKHAPEQDHSRKRFR